MSASANGLPSAHANNNLELLSSSEADGITTISFKRKIATCDNDDNSITVSEKTLIIFQTLI